MDLLDILGHGICHRDPARTIDGMWLCGRCSGLYAGGLLGVAAGGAFARRWSLPGQLVLAGLLLLPMGVDTLVLGRGAPQDVMAVRAVTGLLAGLGSGLFLGGRAAPHVALPTWPRRLGPPWVWVAAASLGAVALAVGTRWATPADLVVGAGLALLCAAGTAWGLHLGASLAGRATGNAAWRRARFGAGVLALAVVAELVLVSVVPNEYKPSPAWLRWLVQLWP